ncbi:MAG: ferredoxin [Actinobacteria bacterium]|nr:ferredoxin [Actinomycetota bacterium]MCG2796952.1 ferredoxin [Cellulomonas sp.]
MTRELIIDRTRCVGHGSCAELLPELLALDEWGYPSNPSGPVPAELDRLAKRAVTMCPALALRIAEVAEPRR